MIVVVGGSIALTSDGKRAATVVKRVWTSASCALILAAAITAGLLMVAAVGVGITSGPMIAVLVSVVSTVRPVVSATGGRGCRRGRR